MKGLLIGAILLAAACSALGQACGGSQFTFTLYVPSGKVIKLAKYKVYPVTRIEGGADEQWLQTTFGRGQELTAREPWATRPIRLTSPANAEAFIKTYDPKLYRPQDTRWSRKNELQGVFTAGQATFATAETDSTPYLLQIIADGYEPAYILGTFMGGCKQNADVVLYAKRR